MKDTKIDADPYGCINLGAQPRRDSLTKRYHGLIAKETIAQIKNPFLTVRYFGNKAAISFPAGSEFSKIEEKIAL